MRRPLPSWLPYIAPLLVFLILTQFEMSLGPEQYPLLYTIKFAVVTAILAKGIRLGRFPELRFEWRYLPIGLALGVVLCVLWVVIDAHTPHFAFLGSRSGYNPWLYIHDPVHLYEFLIVRFAGLVVLVPIMEELFYRSLVLRFAIEPTKFESVPIGKYDLMSCIFTVVVMAAGHPEWLAAAAFSLSMNLLIYRTKSLFACIVTHGATNLALGIYVIYAHAWRYW
jgi:uncharacterized protein